MKYSYLFIITLLGQGCILKKMAVSNADIGIESQIEKRLPLYSVQKDKLSLDTDKFLNGSKPNLLSALPLIQSLELKEDKVEAQLEALKGSYVVIATDYLKLLTKYMAQLDEKQQKKFWEKFDETTSDYKKRSLDQQQEKLEDRFEMFFDEVTPAQLKLLKTHAQYQIFNHAESLTARRALRDRLVTIFSQSISPDEKSALMTQTYLDYQNDLLDNEKTMLLLKSIMPTLDEDQKKHFKKISKEIEELIGYFIAKKF